MRCIAALYTYIHSFLAWICYRTKFCFDFSGLSKHTCRFVPGAISNDLSSRKRNKGSHIWYNAGERTVSKFAYVYVYIRWSPDAYFIPAFIADNVCLRVSVNDSTDVFFLPDWHLWFCTDAKQGPALCFLITQALIVSVLMTSATFVLQTLVTHPSLNYFRCSIVAMQQMHFSTAQKPVFTNDNAIYRITNVFNFVFRFLVVKAFPRSSPYLLIKLFQGK